MFHDEDVIVSWKGVERLVRYEEEMLMRAELLIRCELCESLI